MEKREELYSGKAKSVFKTDDPDRYILTFRNDTSAFDGVKVEQLDRKGMVNNKFNAFIMAKLQAAGIPTHFESLLGDTESVVKRLDMLPIECVVRNYAAGSLVKRLGVTEGQALAPPTIETFTKADALHDPTITKYHIRVFRGAPYDQLARTHGPPHPVNARRPTLFTDTGLLHGAPQPNMRLSSHRAA